MEAKKAVKPAPAATGNGLRNADLSATGQFSTANSIRLQEIRVAWLARRFTVSPDLAVLIAFLALWEARG